jgi:hypothetical protein
LPGAFLDDVTVRLGPYAAKAEPLNASADTTAPAAMARRMNLLMSCPFSEFFIRRKIAPRVNISLTRESIDSARDRLRQDREREPGRPTTSRAELGTPDR